MKTSDPSPLPSSSRRDPFRLQSLGGADTAAADVNWLWHGYLAPGRLTLLTSLWKSGKTTLLSVLLTRMKAGGELLGLPVRPARALVLSEESGDLWRMRRQRLSFGEETGVISQPFAGKPSASNEEDLAAIQKAWHEEWKLEYGDD